MSIYDISSKYHIQQKEKNKMPDIADEDLINPGAVDKKLEDMMTMFSKEKGAGKHEKQP